MTGFALASQLQASSCLQALWEDGSLCDCTLCPAGANVEHGLQAHRVVLAAASPYCRALLSGLWGEHQALTCVIDLPTLPADSVLTVLTAVYSGRLQVRPSLALGAHANVLLMPRPSRMCFGSQGVSVSFQVHIIGPR